MAALLALLRAPNEMGEVHVFSIGMACFWVQTYSVGERDPTAGSRTGNELVGPAPRGLLVGYRLGAALARVDMCLTAMPSLLLNTQTAT